MAGPSMESDLLPRSDPEAPMSVRCWGVRGSTPISGPDCLVFGGDTMCIEVAAGERRLVVDAGTGLFRLGKDLVDHAARRIDIVLTHFHIDHVVGLTGFAPLFKKGAVVTIHAPILDEGSLRGLCTWLLGPPFFPVRPQDVGAEFAIREFRPGVRFEAGGLDISTCRLSHPGGACGYRIGHGGRSVAVIADHEHGSPETDAAVASFCAGSDLLLYDAHWEEDVDYARHRGWGHSTWQAGAALAQAVGAGRLACVHHAPQATDQALLAREARLKARLAEGCFARQGEIIQL
jgi:phosphoribosyl 1,2-cyclic phosphodiesterase